MTAAILGGAADVARGGPRGSMASDGEEWSNKPMQGM